MITFQGAPTNINEPIIGTVVKFIPKKRFRLKKNYILASNSLPKYISGIAGAIVSEESSVKNIPCISGISTENISLLKEGDVLQLNPTGQICRLWNSGSAHNVILITNECNCKCIMCPQPRMKDPLDQLKFNKTILEHVYNDDPSAIAFSGGEPTLKIDDLCCLLDVCKKKFPNTAISLLTNGRVYCDYDAAKKVASIVHPNLMHCVSIYADVNTIHDEIMGVAGSFKETVIGLHNLAILRQQIELRVVILRNNYERLPQLSEFIYRNFPFASHIAFMGLETTGIAWINTENIWVDSAEYISKLKEAVQHLHQRDLCVSIYNIPLCIIPRELWVFARDSISDWKKTFLENCHNCSSRDKCCGVFSTSKRTYKGIQPL